MKKLLMMLSFAIFTNSLFAQLNSLDPVGTGSAKMDKKKKIELLTELMMGINISNIVGGEISNTELIGFLLGGGINAFNFSEQMGVRTEVIYSQQGAKSSYGENSYYSSTTTTRLNYLNVPVLAQYQTKSGFFAEAGLQPGILLSAKQKRTSSGMGGSGTTNTDIKKDLKGFDLGLPLGVGYTYKKKVSVGARFTPGLLKLSKTDGAVKQTNSVLSARLGYIF